MGLVFSRGEAGYGPSTYYQGVPLRVVLPVVLILASLLLLTRGRQPDSRPWGVLAALGVLAGITAMNNLEFGLPALLAVVVAMCLVSPSMRAAITSTAAFILSAALVPAVYVVIGHVLGKDVDLANALLFARVFGANNYFATLMDPFGRHVVVAVLFASAMVIGALLLIVRRPAQASSMQRMGVALVLTGTWSLFSLTYFSSRSLPPVLWSGFAVQIAIVSVALLPWLRVAVGEALASRRVDGWQAASFGLAVVGLVVAGSFIIEVPGPEEAAHRISHVNEDYLAEQVQQLGSLGDLGLDPTTGQILVAPALTQLRTGVRSASAVNNPSNLEVSIPLAQLQCRHVAESDLQRIIVSEETARALLSTEVCADILKPDAAASGDSGLQVLRVNR